MSGRAVQGKLSNRAQLGAWCLAGCLEATSVAPTSVVGRLDLGLGGHGTVRGLLGEAVEPVRADCVSVCSPAPVLPSVGARRRADGGGCPVRGA
jgi:hypothetical protein